jgi:hypothetical protein
MGDRHSTRLTRQRCLHCAHVYCWVAEEESVNMGTGWKIQSLPCFRRVNFAELPGLQLCLQICCKACFIFIAPGTVKVPGNQLTRGVPPSLVGPQLLCHNIPKGTLVSRSQINCEDRNADALLGEDCGKCIAGN